MCEESKTNEILSLPPRDSGFVNLCCQMSMTTAVKYLIFLILVHGGEISGFFFIWYQLQAVTERKSKGSGANSSAVSTTEASSSG